MAALFQSAGKTTRATSDNSPNKASQQVVSWWEYSFLPFSQVCDVSSTGTDSQPFNRIMAPLSQSAKFDAADYIREWVPELAHLSDEDIHDPQERGSYPAPLIGHKEARERALAARGSPG